MHRWNNTNIQQKSTLVTLDSCISHHYDMGTDSVRMPYGHWNIGVVCWQQRTDLFKPFGILLVISWLRSSTNRLHGVIAPGCSFTTPTHINTLQIYRLTVSTYEWYFMRELERILVSHVAQNTEFTDFAIKYSRKEISVFKSSHINGQASKVSVVCRHLSLLAIAGCITISCRLRIQVQGCNITFTWYIGTFEQI